MKGLFCVSANKQTNPREHDGQKQCTNEAQLIDCLPWNGMFMFAQHTNEPKSWLTAHNNCSLAGRRACVGVCQSPVGQSPPVPENKQSVGAIINIWISDAGQTISANLASTPTPPGCSPISTVAHSANDGGYIIRLCINRCRCSGETSCTGLTSCEDCVRLASCQFEFAFEFATVQLELAKSRNRSHWLLFICQRRQTWQFYTNTHILLVVDTFLVDNLCVCNTCTECVAKKKMMILC